jgi:DNA-binding NarL/FixJ family response regulator
MDSPESASASIKLLIADDHAMFRQGLRLLLRSEPDVSIVGEARDGLEAVAMTHQLSPDVLLLDVAMPGLSGLEVVHRLHESRATTRVILLTAALQRSEIPPLLKLGVRGVVVKESAVDVLIKAVRVVHGGEFWIGREVIGDLVQALTSPSIDPHGAEKSPFGLTKREIEIVALVAAGYSNKDIARECALRENTVKHHLSNIFDKTGVSTRLELALFALSNRLTKS